MVIDRWECEQLKMLGGWLLVYGRRKVGKTWLLRRCVEWDVYVVVGRDGFCWVERRGGGVERLGVDECLELVGRVVRGGGTVVLDEFQRLPLGSWDFLALLRQEAEGRLVLCGSSLGIVSRVFEPRSPLLGILAPVRIDIAGMADTIASLARFMGPRDAVLWAVVARDPWLLGLVEPRGDPLDVLAARARELSLAASALVGEVFGEEERQLTRLYDAVLRLLASGLWSSKALAAHLYNAHLISSPSPGIVTGVLAQLEAVGLAAKIPLWRTRGARYYYKHRSPLLALLYAALDQIEELDQPPTRDQLLKTYALELQFSLGELLAQHHAAQQAYTILPGPEGDIDIVLLDRRKRPLIAYEVKLGKAEPEDAKRLKQRAEKLGIARIGIVALGGADQETRDLVDELVTPEKLVQIATTIAAKQRRQPLDTTATTKQGILEG